MREKKARSARILGAVLVLSMVVGLQAPAQANQRRSLRVMTRNLYLGASLTPIFQATTPTDALLAATQAFQQVLNSNFPARAEALADELAEEMPHLVGLQEVTLYRTGPGRDPAPATTPVLDFLAVLQAEIAERGLPYAVASQVSAFDGELTILTSDTPTFADIRLTDRDVILVRTDLDPETFSVSGATSGIFAATLPLPVADGSTLVVERGWTSVEVKYRGKGFRFIDTHLEAFHPVVQQIQSLELLAGPANTPKPVVMAGDFNSPADGSGSTSYANIVGGGFSDAWSTVHPGDPGYTCCHAANLMGPSSLTTRIDIVFFRGAGFDAVEAEIVGDEESDKTAGGLWPSDHAGVVTTITFGPRPDKPKDHHGPPPPGAGPRCPPRLRWKGPVTGVEPRDTLAPRRFASRGPPSPPPQHERRATYASRQRPLRGAAEGCDPKRTKPSTLSVERECSQRDA